MQLKRLYIGLTLPIAIGCSFYVTQVSAQTVVSPVSEGREQGEQGELLEQGEKELMLLLPHGLMPPNLIGSSKNYLNRGCPSTDSEYPYLKPLNLSRAWSKPVDTAADTGRTGHGDTGILEKNSPLSQVSPSPCQSQPTTYDHTHLSMGFAPPASPALPAPPALFSDRRVPSLNVTTPTPVVSRISEQQAENQATKVRIYPGRSSIIDFRNGETITYIRLANLERIVYDTNAPLESGLAKLIVLNLIEPLPFGGQTRPPSFGQRGSTATNLTVNTIDSSGELMVYIFDLIPATGAPGSNEGNGVAIISQDTPGVAALSSASQSSPLQAKPTVQTTLGLATLTDISRGLQISLSREYSAPDDPIVFQVEEFLALAQNGVPMLEAAQQLNIPLSVIVSLGELGIIEQIRRGFKQGIPTAVPELRNDYIRGEEDEGIRRQGDKGNLQQSCRFPPSVHHFNNQQRLLPKPKTGNSEAVEASQQPNDDVHPKHLKHVYK